MISFPKDTVVPASIDILPNGVGVIELYVVGELRDMPPALEYEGKTYGRSGWNSDRNVAFYRTDRKTVKIIKG